MNNEIHIGQKIKEVMKEQGRKTIWLAKKIPCSCNNIYDIYSKKSINTELLEILCDKLSFNFFQWYADEWKKKEKTVNSFFEVL
jgi:hypothetical protein